MRARQVGSWLHLLVAGALMLAVWLLLTWVGSRPALKALIDMSPGQRATVDPVTIELLAELQAQDVRVEFHTFYLPSGQQPQDEAQLQMQQILGRLRELTTVLLRQYQFHGGDHVRLFEHDQFVDAAATRAAAQRFAVNEYDVVVVAVQQPGREPRHRRLSLEGDLAVIDLPGLRQHLPSLPRAGVPVLKDYKGEEALSSALKSLLVQGTPTIYVGRETHDLSYNPAVGAGYGLLLQALGRSGFEVREFDPSRGAVPKDASMVAVLEPRREFAEIEVRALHSYLRRGGRLFLNYSFAEQPDWNHDGGELGRLLGFAVGSRQVFHLVPDHRGASPGISGLPGVEKLDLVLNPNHAITRRLALANQPLQVAAARPLEALADAPQGVRREPLLQTGPSGWLAPPRRGELPDYDAPRLASGFDTFTVGSIIEVDGTDPDADGKPTTGVAVVVSGVFANNAGIPVNGQLALNICNWLCERRVLLDIKGSSYVARHLEASPQQLGRIRWLLVAGVPGTFLLLGLFVYFRRRSA